MPNKNIELTTKDVTAMKKISANSYKVAKTVTYFGKLFNLPK